MNYIPEQSLFAAEGADAARVISTLLAVRATTVRAGNRRQLFAAMDQILDESELDERAGQLEVPSSVGGEAVRLDRLRLRNWKSFERADLAIPRGEDARPVVIVGGENGFGKSSILEAFALGLFGRRALSDLGFLMHAGGGRAGQRRSYRSLVERNLHRSARAGAEAICSVGLDFTTADGPVTVERKWYFEPDGSLVEDEEELLLRVGEDRSLLDIPHGVAAMDWYQDEIERRILPASLAPFFVFDGEQVERWSERRLSDQVRSALARMLGLDDLVGLAEDLRAFAKDRERGAGTERGPDVAALRAELERLEQEAAADRSSLAEHDALLASLRDGRDELLTGIAALSAGSHSDLQSLFETQHRLAAELKVQVRELLAVLVEHGPLALCGPRLVARTVGALDAGMPSEFDALGTDGVEALVARLGGIEPPLGEEAREDLRRRLAMVLDQRRAGGSDNAHAHLDMSFRRKVSARLRREAEGGLARISEIEAARHRTLVAIEACRAAVGATEGRAAERAAAQERLAALSASIEEAEGARGFVRRQLEAVKARIEPFQAELLRRSDQLREAEPRLRTAALARTMASTIDHHMALVSDGEHRRFADAVTARFRSLAHKGQISRIEIGRDGSVVLRDGQGRDVTEYRMSAGEGQLFAMALIGAVGDVVGDRLPLIVDTPLGRLDSRHRGSVLDMLAGRRSQTILLTQPEEVSARHLERLRPVLAGAVTIVHAEDPQSGVGVSRFVEGYHPEALP